MKRRTYIILNLIFILITILSLILSLVFQFFFFIPLICFFPWTWTSYREKDQEVRQKAYFELIHKEAPQYCQECGGKIEQDGADYCYHCGAKLPKKDNYN